MATSRKDTRGRSELGPFALVPRWVLRAPISDRAVRLYALLADHVTGAEGDAIPSVPTLAAMLGDCSPDSVRRARTELVELGALTVTERRRADGGQTSNTYTVRATPPRTGARGRRRRTRGEENPCAGFASAGA